MIVLHHPSQPFPGSGQARHHSPDRHVQNACGISVTQLLDRYEQQDATLILRQAIHGRHDIRLPDAILLGGRLRHRRVIGIVELNMVAPSAFLPQPIDGKVVEDCEHPGPGIPVIPALIPAADRPLQTVLYKVIRRGRIAHKRAGVAAERGNKRLDKARHVTHTRFKQRGFARVIMVSCRPQQSDLAP